MSRMRSFSFPKLGSSKRQDENMSGAESPYHFALTHSRESSGASSASSPCTPTFSNRSHSHWHSSNSSLATTPDSPVNVTKSPLHDLVEDPEEREEGSFDIIRRAEARPYDEPLCICDTPFCVHQKDTDIRSTVIASPAPEWTPGDDFELASQNSFKRRRSGEPNNESLTSRVSRRWPSISQRWRDQQPLRSVSSPAVHSAPASRSSSLRLRDLKKSLSGQLDERNKTTPPFTPVDTARHDVNLPRRQAGLPLDIQIPEVEDPVDRQELASTPLLPPALERHLNEAPKGAQSPLQSPSVADHFETFSYNNTPVLTPMIPGLPTPPLSSRPSVASFGRSSTSHNPTASDIPPMTISNDNDPWASRLGHANFQISPEPYFPEECNLQSCKRLLEDWAGARREYRHQVAHVTEHYGPTSNTFKLTEQKWSEIDATWRANHQLASVQAGINIDSLVHETMAETAPTSKISALKGSQQLEKFPKIDEADIVGPMVQYARIQRQPARRAGFLKLFTDPASLLGKSPFGSSRR